MPPYWRAQSIWLAKRLRRHVPAGLYRALYGLGRLGYLPHYRHPRTFNEKVTWWIQHRHDPRLTRRADKLLVRDFVATAAPWVRLPEVYAVAKDAAQFPFEQLPETSVLKSNHGWHQVQVLRRPFDVEAMRALAGRWLAHPYGTPEWEWHYLTIERRLYAEQYLGASDGSAPPDYKVLVLNGRAAYVWVYLGRGGRLRRVVFDRDWRVVPVYQATSLGGPPDVVGRELHPPRPKRLADMLRAAEVLADDLPFVRADFYLIDDEIYFGELTFFPAGGYVEFVPVSYDRVLGDALDVGSDRAHGWSRRRSLHPTEGLRE